MATAAHKIVECDPCQNRKAVSFCTECREFYCTECSSLHKTFKATRNHTQVYISTRDQKLRKIVQCEPCWETKNTQSATSVCVECREPYCDKCSTYHGIIKATRDHMILKLSGEKRSDLMGVKQLPKLFPKPKSDFSGAQVQKEKVVGQSPSKIKIKSGNVTGTSLKAKLGHTTNRSLKANLGDVKDTSLKAKLGDVKDTSLKAKLGNVTDTSLKAKLVDVKDTSLKAKLGDATNTSLKAKLGDVTDTSLKAKLGDVADTSLKAKLVDITDTSLKAKLGDAADTSLKVTYWSEFSPRIPSDTNWGSFEVFRMLTLPDDRVVALDWVNYKLKLFSADYQIIHYCDVDKNSTGLTSVDDTTLAVSCGYAITLYTVHTERIQKSTFIKRDRMDGNMYDICSKDNKFVCLIHHDNNKWCIDVVDMKGHSETIFTENSRLHRCNHIITVDKNSFNINIGNDDVRCLTLDGRKLWAEPVTYGPRGMTLVGKRLLAVGKDEGDVRQISLDGKLHDEPVLQRLNEPNCICYQQKRNRILLSSFKSGSQIKVYQVD